MKSVVLIKSKKKITVIAIVMLSIAALLLLFAGIQRLEISSAVIASQADNSFDLVLRQNIFGDGFLYCYRDGLWDYITKIYSFDRDDKLMDINWVEKIAVYRVVISREHGKNIETIDVPIDRALPYNITKVDSKR